MKNSVVLRELEGLIDRQQFRESRREQNRRNFKLSLQGPFRGSSQRTSPARMLPQRENEAASQKTLGSQSSLTEELIWKNPSRRY